MSLRDCLNVQAKIRLKTTEEGGRRNGILTGYRPNHVFEYYDDKMIRSFIGEIQFETNRVIELGREEIVTICFLPVDELKKYISVGRHWFIHEGERLVGEGTILKLE